MVALCSVTQGLIRKLKIEISGEAIWEILLFLLFFFKYGRLIKIYKNQNFKFSYVFFCHTKK